MATKYKALDLEFQSYDISNNFLNPQYYILNIV